MENQKMEVFDYFVNLNKPQSNQRFANAIGKENVLFLVNSTQDEFALHPGHFSFKSTFQGREHFEFDNHRVAVSPQHYLLLNEGQEYASYINSDENVETFTIFFSPEFVTNTLKSRLRPDDALLNDGHQKETPLFINFFEKLYHITPYIYQLIQHIRLCLKEGNAHSMALEEYLYMLLHELLKEHRMVKSTIEQLSAVRYSTRLETYRRVSRAKDYLLSCYDEPLSIDKLASVACLAPFHFLRTFKQIFNITPHQMLTKVRLQHAQSLLVHTNYPVSQISLKVGYDNLSSFSRLFTTQFGMSPRKFRKQKATSLSA
ncbi:helix-turn-helix domain-containing protein [uncultured Microscilla sp.]|uniref:helix-turn-helix domain-containing protein n=1 Tax=uncultured Microscilla sp. TaxID=432653 RepID=UPI0026342AAA|nr:AraC family transcriptional regulator [uncultured Microscilla sp.]